MSSFGSACSSSFCTLGRDYKFIHLGSSCAPPCSWCASLIMPFRHSRFGTMDDEVVEDDVHVDEAKVRMRVKQWQYDQKLFDHCGGISSDPPTPPMPSLAETPAWSDRDRRIELDGVARRLHIALCIMQRRRFDACVAWCDRLYLWQRRRAFGGMHDV